MTDPRKEHHQGFARWISVCHPCLPLGWSTEGCPSQSPPGHSPLWHLDAPYLPNLPYPQIGSKGAPGPIVLSRKQQAADWLLRPSCWTNSCGHTALTPAHNPWLLQLRGIHEIASNKQTNTQPTAKCFTDSFDFCEYVWKLLSNTHKIMVIFLHFPCPPKGPFTGSKLRNA